MRRPIKNIGTVEKFMYEKIALPNGVRIVTEKVEHVRSASVGIWIKNGSRHEPEPLGGISHFIEHMVFKGTEERTAEDIAEAMDALGGQFNAFTTKEYTCYYLKVLDTHIKTGLTVLADMFLRARFAEEDIALERGVVFEEIDMYEDTPEDLATEKLFEHCFDGSALGCPILGTRESLSGMTSEVLHDYVSGHYLPQDTVVALSGRFDESDLDFIYALFSPMRGDGRNQIQPAAYQPAIVVRPKEIEQNHLCIGFPGLPIGAEERYAMQVMSAILGGGMSSRLFQSVREQNGLCYSIYSFVTNHIDTGMFSIYTALGKNTEERAVSLISKVLREFCAKGAETHEVTRVREQLKANILMGMESTSTRMHQLGKGELLRGRAVQADELIAQYDAVTAEQVTALARRLLDFEQSSICAVGQTGNADYYRGLLQ